MRRNSNYNKCQIIYRFRAFADIIYKIIIIAVTCGLQGTTRLKMIISSFSASQTAYSQYAFFVCLENEEILSV